MIQLPAIIVLPIDDGIRLTSLHIIGLAIALVFAVLGVIGYRRNDRYIENKLQREARSMCRHNDHSWMKFGFTQQDDEYKNHAFIECRASENLPNGWTRYFTVRTCNFCKYRIEWQNGKRPTGGVNI